MSKWILDCLVFKTCDWICSYTEFIVFVLLQISPNADASVFQTPNDTTKRMFMTKANRILLRILWNEIGNRGRTVDSMASLSGMKNCKLRALFNECCLDFIGQSIYEISHFASLRHCLQPSKWCDRRSAGRNIQQSCDIHLNRFFMLNPNYAPIWS